MPSVSLYDFTALVSCSFWVTRSYLARSGQYLRGYRETQHDNQNDTILNTNCEFEKSWISFSGSIPILLILGKLWNTSPSQGLEKIDSVLRRAEAATTTKSGFLRVAVKWSLAQTETKYSHVLCNRGFCELPTRKYGEDRSCTRLLLQEGQSRTYGLPWSTQAERKGTHRADSDILGS